VTCEVEVKICNQLGLHLRAAAALAKLAESFESEVLVRKDGTTANGKSVIALVTLNAPLGTSLEIVAEGPDAEQAVSDLKELVETRFGEAQ